MKGFLTDQAEQLWTYLGMTIAWFVLDGSAKTVTGYMIAGTAFLWAITYPLRKDKEEK